MGPLDRIAMNVNHAASAASPGLAVDAPSSGPAVADNPEPLQKLELFSTCPSSLTTPDGYLKRVEAVARWSEKAGCTGILIYTDNTLVDPWMVSQIVLQSTASLCPLVAVQPVYMHPYSVAKMVWSVGVLYGRRMFLNMVAGGFKNDLTALGDATPHDSRYRRLVEYTQIIQQLLRGEAPVTMDGQFYKVSGLKLGSRLAPELHPGILVSGSSEAGLAAAREMGATPVKYPEPLASTDGTSRANSHCGVRIGIVTRPRAEDAWSVAHDRFPADRKGQLTRQLASKVSDWPGTSSSPRSERRAWRKGLTGCTRSKTIRQTVHTWWVATKPSPRSCANI